MVVLAFRNPEQLDFPYILTAGRMWAAGLDPYGPAFAAYGGAVLPPGARTFAYPPNWWPIATALGLLGDDAALTAWKILNIAATAAAGLILIDAARRIEGRRLLWTAAIFLAVLFTSDVIRNTLQLGQTSAIVLLGFALLMNGLARRGPALQATGLALLMLKPHYGLLFLLLMLTRRETRNSALIALAVTIGACLPILVQLGLSGTLESAQNFFGNLQAYSAERWNWPLYASGLPHLFAYAGITLPAVAALFAAWALAEWIIRSAGDANHADFVRTFWFASAASICALLPLHVYDFALLFPCLLLIGSFHNRAAKLLLVLAIAIAWTATRATTALFFDPADPNYYWTITRAKAGLLTAVGFALLIAVIIGLKGHRRAEP